MINAKINLKEGSSFFYGWKPLILLINESFWKSFFGPFFAFIFPLIFISILGVVLGYNEVLGGSLAISPMATTITSMPMAIFEFKKSSLLKRIGSTPIKSELFILIVVFFYLLVIAASIIWCILFAMLCFGIPYWNEGKVMNTNGIALITMSFKETLQKVNWGGFIWSQFLLIIIGLTIGMNLVSFSKSSLTIQAVGTTILITSQFFASIVMPLGMVRGIEGFWYTGYVFSPFKPAANMLLESWNGNIEISFSSQLINPIRIYDFTSMSNPFNVNQPYYYLNGIGKTFLVFNKTEKIVSQVLPFVWILLLGSTSIKFFKWSAR